MMERKLKHEVNIETIKAVPAVGGATIASLTLNEWVAVATLCYIILQAAFLVWKWRVEANKK